MYRLLLTVHFVGVLHVRAQLSPAVNVTGTAGGQAHLPCSVKNIGLYETVLWQGPYQETISHGINVVASDRNRYKLKQEYADDWGLTISNLKSSDQAEYRCMKGATLVQIVNLWIKAPPRILNQNRTVNTFLGDKLMIRCQVTGTPLPTVKWYKEILDNGVRLLEDLGTTGSYFSLNVTRDSGGIYTCRADNGISPHADRYFRVNVQLMPIITAPKRVEQERGKEVRLQCIVEGYPRGNVTWWYKGKQLTKDYRTTFSVYDSTSHTARYSLIISALESYDFGVYTCKASNNAGTTQGQIELSQILSEIKESRCEKMSVRKCQGVLQSNFTLLPNSKGHRKQEDASLEFSQFYPVIQCSKYMLPFLCGTYFPPCVNDTVYPVCPYLCEQSQGGCASALNNLDFEWPFTCIDFYHRLNGSSVCVGTSGIEKVASFIKITESSDDQNLLEEEKLTLYCKALANSGYHIKWYKISKTSYISRPEKSEVGNGMNYIIESINRDDAGLYVCEATNENGVMDSRNITVDVEFAPKVLVQAEVALMTGLDMGLKCDVLGNPPPVVSWTKNNIELKIGREMHSKYSYSYTLKITNMSEIDLGEYTCSAFNILGNDVGVTTIKDYGKPVSTTGSSDVTSTIATTQARRPTAEQSRDSSTSPVAEDKSGESQAVSHRCHVPYLILSISLTLFIMFISHH
ncbi:hemicentin-2-like isoform X2 [Ostrea edulis]|uniref:hemicentin-2-like isoform X2 n=1 Tax=Ostrea edulis TaxID=37623 RepID=UPI0024AFAFEB|nr:hemicentin-2-like isoform X2 [Ostrea edulis]